MSAEDRERKGQPGGANASVRTSHKHAIPLDMEDIERDWNMPISEANIAAKTSVIMRVGMLDLGAGTGSFRVREMMNRIAYPLGVYVRADVNLTDIEASCTDGKRRITEVVDLPTTGVNTERIWLLEHFADWFNVNLGMSSVYHTKPTISQELLRNLGNPLARTSAMRAVKLAERERAQAEAEEAAGAADENSGSESEHAKQPSGSVNDSAQSSTEQPSGITNNGGQQRTQQPPSGTDHAAQQHVEQPLESSSNGAQSPDAEASNHRHKPLAGEYAEHFDHVGTAASESAGITVGQAHERLDLIERRAPLYTPAVAGLASACACSAFVFLLGGGPYDMLGAFVGAGLGHWLRRRLFARRLNQFFVTFVSVALAALVCTAVLRLVGIFDPVALQHDTAYIGAMLFVIPGFPLITGGLDIFKIDFPSGIQRLCYTLAIILMATLAGWMIAAIVRLNPEGFEPLGLNPFVNAGLRFLAAFVGVWGFSIMFNSPQRMCFTAAIIGAITDTLRLTVIDFGVPPETGAFFGAFLAGLLASAWRDSVRRGWIAPYLGYPRICLTVPSIVIMVPGLYMYQAMFHLGEFETLQALDWGFRAFMVIICLPIGLAMARMVTDKNWRYDT